MMYLPMQFPLRDVIAPGPVETIGLLFLALFRYLVPVVIIGVIVVVIVKLIKRKKAKQAAQQPGPAASEADHAGPGSADGDSDS